MTGVRRAFHTHFTGSSSGAPRDDWYIVNTRRGQGVSITIPHHITLSYLENLSLPCHTLTYLVPRGWNSPVQTHDHLQTGVQRPLQA